MHTDAYKKTRHEINVLKKYETSTLTAAFVNGTSKMKHAHEAC